ncbi:patatin-like phospholipase family protein [Roseomonas sp. NAR14]|uniref:Patatin-like phospholipase family protein n=1 Tax=Roseomonas acroporae TaxID=2937791 RepID=A0A9X1YHD8_9PROT|nr:patatin-like phospholipase family protein [Roseomonas acroporae]MCK8786196.1 patatin-like phospholipase family protein [Roseomonas acroporae]
MDATTGDGDPPGWRPARCDRVALVLQGGGALGAYQAGVYQALHEAGIQPDWICGVSIGAVNAALIAGNPPERRLDALRCFWDRVTTQDLLGPLAGLLQPPAELMGDDLRRLRNLGSATAAALFGQNGFFRPNRLSPWLVPRGAPGATAWYTTEPLRETLLELVDFDRINDRRLRFAVGAVNVLSGNFIYFDNAEAEITPEHVMASGALPPGLPMVRVGTDWFWDGGLVSNTPLQHVLEAEEVLNTLVFQVDLFSARGPLPRDMEDVLGREKDIRYSSRTRYNTDMYQRIHGWKVKLKQALEKVPEERLSDEERLLKEQLSDLPEVVVLQLIYQQKVYEGNARDYEFSRATMLEHWESGLADTRRTLLRKEWLEMPQEDSGLVAHDVHRAEE